MAIKALLPGTDVSAVVCWADTLLVKLADSIVLVGRGFTELPREHRLPEALKLQQDDASLRAAAQLPKKWQDVASVIASADTSPAARRLALRLIFGVLIISPLLKKVDLWTFSDMDPSYIKDVMQRSIATIAKSFSLNFSSDQFTELDRISFAMILCIVAVADSAHEESQDTLSPWIPHTHGTFLHLIQAIMHPDSPVATLSVITPLAELDSAQTIFIRWGRTIRWCWETWNDPRTADSETVMFVTVNWLHHVCSDLKPPVGFATQLDTDLSAAYTAIIAVLHHLVLSLHTLDSGSPALPDILSGACRFTVFLLQRNLDSFDNRLETRVTDICKRLAHLFVLIPERESHLSVLDSILEAFALIQSKPLQSAFAQLQDDPKVPWSSTFHKLISESRKMITKKEPTSSELYVGKLTLNFLSIAWSRGCQKYTLPTSSVQFLLAVADAVIRKSTTSDILLSSVLNDMALCNDKSVFAPQSLRYISIWERALSSPRSNLPIAVAFAHFILAADPLLDAIHRAEAWDYLRDVLILVLRQRYYDEGAALSILISDVVCYALLRLVDRHDGTWIIQTASFLDLVQ
ncbi:hypothetical protein C8J56DRAFT_1041389 [Mycena floridula]|nr:hypothetical protein C8J56DRAFT_1041389 [Mycena floridula]